MIKLFKRSWAELKVISWVLRDKPKSGLPKQGPRKHPRLLGIYRNRGSTGNH